MKKLLSEKGINLVEAVVGLGLIGVVAYGFMSSSTNMTQSATQQKQSDFVEDLMMRNISRLKASKSDTFPVYGENRLRQYHSNGELIQETTVGSCDNLSLKQGQVSICIKYLSVDNAEVEFSNSDFMKLPKFGQKLYKLDITGETISAGRRLFKKIIIFKR